MRKFKFSISVSTIFISMLGFGTAKVFSQKITRQAQVAMVQTSGEESTAKLPVATPEPPTDYLGSSATNTSLARVGVRAGETMPLTLNEAIRKVLENNNDIEIARNDVKIAESTLRSLLGFYDPVFTVNPQFTDAVQPQASTLGGADISGFTSSTEFKVDSSFNQPIRKGGGTFSILFDNRRNETSSRFSELNPTFTTNLGFSFTQPLLKNFRIDQTRQQIRVQRKRVAQSDADFRRQTIEIISQVQAAYWDLVFTLRDQQNRVVNLNLSKENLRQIEAKIAAGAAAPLSKAEVETELAARETEVLIRTQQVSVAENVLKRLLLKDPNSPEWEVQYVPTDKPVFSTDPIDLAAVLKDAVENRPELSRLKLQREINTIDVSYFENQLRPQVDFGASYTMVGLAGTAVGSTTSSTRPLISGTPGTSPDAFLLQQIQNLTPNPIIVPDVGVPATVPLQFVGGYGKSLSNLFKNDSRTLVVGLTISFPLRNQTAEADLATARFQQAQIDAQTRSQEQSIIAEVRNAVQAVETSRQRVLTARRAREYAEIQLDGERKLFDAGRSTAFLLFDRENTLANAKNLEIKAETDYNKSLSDLQRATSTTFLLNNIEYDSPIDQK